MKRLNGMLAALLLICLCLPATAFAEDAEMAIVHSLIGEEGVKKQSIKSKYKSYDELGVDNELLAIWKSDEGYAFHAKIHHGAEYYEAPYMQVYVGMDKEGKITGVQLGEYVDHTPSFVDLVTPEYLAYAYVGQTASVSYVTDGVSGATFTSDTVQYAVRLCSRYAQAVLRLLKEEAQDVQMKKLALVVPGTYEKLELDAAFESAAGTVQYAAKGTTGDGRAFTALVVRSGFVPGNPANNMTLPTYQIWIDAATHEIFMADMLTGQFYEGFEMPQDKLESYYGVALESADVFDSYMLGLNTSAPEIVLTSATGSFEDTLTGATPQGNDTTLSVRACFIAAAQYYCSAVR